MGRYSIKNIALGIGLGMILSSILNISFNNKELSTEDIKNEAIKHNLIIISPNELIKKQTESNDESKVYENNFTNENNFTEVTISIKKGYNSKEVAKILKENGLISDEKVFLDQLNKAGKSYKLQAGEYQIRKGVTLQEIINILTTYKK